MNWIFALLASIPAFGIWISWAVGNWKLMIICIAVSSIIWLVNPTFGLSKKLGFNGLIFNALVSLPLLIYAYTRLYQLEGLIHNGEVVHSFKTSLYFSVVTLTTLGYGDYQPTENVQLWAAAQALYGYICLAILVGLVITVLSKTRAT